MGHGIGATGSGRADALASTAIVADPDPSTNPPNPTRPQLVVLNPDWDALLAALRTALPQFRVFFVVPSEDRSIRWIRLMSGVGVMDVYGAFVGPESGAARGVVGADGLVGGGGGVHSNALKACCG